MNKHNRKAGSIQVGGQLEHARDCLANCRVVLLPNVEGWGDCDALYGPKGCDFSLEEFETRRQDAHHRQAFELLAPFGINGLEGFLGKETTRYVK